jgi:hypothetical protein
VIARSFALLRTGKSQRVEELRAEPAALNEQIADAEEELSDLVVTQATLARVLGERDKGETEFEQAPARDADPDDLVFSARE